MISKPGHFQSLFDSQKPEEGMKTTHLFMYCSAPLCSGLGQISITHCAKPQGQERKERSWLCSPFCGPTQRNATTTCPFLDAVWLLMLPLKSSNFTLSSSWAAMLLLSPKNSENYSIFINHVKFSNSPSCTQSSLENNNHFHFLGWVQFVTAT